MVRRALLTLMVLVGSSTAALAQLSGEIELTLVRIGDQWRGEAKFGTAGQQLLIPLREIKITNNEIAFTADILQAELSFSGKLNGGGLGGSIKGSQSGSSIASGTWSLARQGGP